MSLVFYQNVVQHPVSLAAWKEYLRLNKEWWYWWHSKVLEMNARKLVVYYEDMKDNLRDVLTQFCQFLDVPAACTEDRMRCVEHNAEGNFHRRSNRTGEADLFTDSDREEIEKHKKQLVREIGLCVDKNECLWRGPGRTLAYQSN